MIRTAALVALALAASACTAGAVATGRGERTQAVAANPSAVIATELAFARAARERGQWTAFRDYAAQDAVLFVPQPVRAQEWLRGRPDPAQAVQWQPHAVWMSCDGTMAVTTGAAQWPDGRPGRFTTVWQRQRDGRYMWVMDHGQIVDTPLPRPDFIQSRVATCPQAGAAITAPERARASEAGEVLQGQAEDRSLMWMAHVRPDGSRTISALLLGDGGFVRVVDDEVGAGGD
ncbi:hypothetical protein EYB45_01765 [Erythrobacteraceae bacterium CFH 75059]|uniref:YybH family protein n=1 Tax=Qipengyuania thermophila TaxID=2509361 RepID=UPI0010203E0A|nr:hypothetical protein [Qipengyuania thermophila]TCD06473.1 hypothetical protein EYB45_01765 [Erythrobacteraceae bacterium CFH 75059]